MCLESMSRTETLLRDTILNIEATDRREEGEAQRKYCHNGERRNRGEHFTTGYGELGLIHITPEGFMMPVKRWAELEKRIGQADCSQRLYFRMKL